MAKIDPNEMCPCQSGDLFKDCHGLKVKPLITPDIIETVLLKVIKEPDPETRSVFIKEGGGTIIFSGDSIGLALVCGNCQKQLVVGIERERLNNLVLQCNSCGNYNEV